MVFTVRIEGRKKMRRCKSGVYIDFYRSDSIWAGRPPLPPTLDVDLDVDPRALPYIGLQTYIVASLELGPVLGKSGCLPTRALRPAGRGPSYPLWGAGRGPPGSHIRYYILHNIYYILYSIQYILYNIYYILHIIYYILYIKYYILYIIYYIILYYIIDNYRGSGYRYHILLYFFFKICTLLCDFYYMFYRVLYDFTYLYYIF